MLNDEAGRTFEGKPLHEAILAKCHEKDIAGATVFPGWRIRRNGGSPSSRALHSDQPLVIVFVDEPARLPRRIMTLRFRPAYIRVIHRRESVRRCHLLCLPKTKRAGSPLWRKVQPERTPNSKLVKTGILSLA
jgi:PII-like signaling protein